MKIIIVGAGKVGYSLAQRLVQDNHDVYVIEKNEERANALQNTLDVNIVPGSGSNMALLHEIGTEDTGMLIAVTDSDEVNMLACSVAKLSGIPRTIARVRDNESWGPENLLMREALGVDLFINPEMVTAQEILQILQTPAALDVEDFANGMVRLMEIKVRNEHDIVGRTLKDITLPEGVLVVGILRSGEMIIPHGNSVILMEDNVFFLGAREGISEIEHWFQESKRQMNRIVIIGAGLIGQNLAVLLEKEGFTVKVIEKRMDRCEKLASMVENTIVICGDGTDVDLLEAEEVGENDAIICLTDDDKLNLLVALLGKHIGIEKSFVRVGRPEYISLMEQVGVDVVFSPRLLTSGKILRLVRSEENLVTVSSFEGSKAEAIEIELRENTPVIGKALKDVTLPGTSLVGAVVRNNESIIPTGATKLFAGDHIVIFTLPQFVSDVLSYLQSK